jgi:tRNA pseudouridine55 synthase
MPSKSNPDAWPSGLVIVDKPGGMTSHDVVARVRRLAHTRRVGHAGTLDPMATGVLVIGIEKATRLLGHLTLTEKTYEATIRLGQSTSTDDAEGEPTGGRPATEVARGALEEEIAKLTGEILQVPSSVSAIKVNGQRAYKLTRAGQAPELAARPVTIYEFRVTAIREEGDYLDLDATIRCSSGTYIRAIARDLGTALGTGGHLTALRRTAVGPYTLAQAHTLKNLEDQSQNQSSGRILVTPAPYTSPQGPEGSAASQAQVGAAAEISRANEPPAVPWVAPLAAAAAAAFPRLNLTDDEARRLAHGARLPFPPATTLLAPWPTASNPPGAVAPNAEPIGAVGHSATADLALGDTASIRPDTPIAAFAPDGTLVALVAAEAGRLRSLAVFTDPVPAGLYATCTDFGRDKSQQDGSADDANSVHVQRKCSSQASLGLLAS